MSLSDIKTLNFEAIKVALKQDKTGYVLTLCIHPDDIPLDLLKDFVGSHYQVVMVRVNDDHQPMDREEEFSGNKAVRLAGILCKEQDFCEYLHDQELIFIPTEEEATTWMRTYLEVSSRSELKTNPIARERLNKINKEYLEWKRKN